MNKENVMMGGAQGFSRRGGKKLGSKCVKSILYADIYITRMMTVLELGRLGSKHLQGMSRNDPLICNKEREWMATPFDRRLIQS